MSEETVYGLAAAAIIASLGLWWFRLIMTGIRQQSKTTRYGIYALVWLAYFIVTLMIVGRAG